jgi:TM2 domain-containing membrane protein YozV
MTPHNHIGWAISQHILIILTTLIIIFSLAFAITLVIRAFYFLNIGNDPIEGWTTKKERTLADVMQDGIEQENIEGNRFVSGFRTKD